MQYDLETLFGVLADRVSSSEGVEFVFSAATLPQPPSQLQTHQLVIKKAEHGYHAYTINQVDALWFYADKRTYKLLALLFLANIFHSIPPEIQLGLTHPKSDVRNVILDYGQPYSLRELVPNYQKQPFQFLYWPEALSKYPLSHQRILNVVLPVFSLTNQANTLGGNEAERRARDTVRCAGSDYGNILFASVLLNFSRPEEICTEVALEGELGYGGVGRGSAEVKLWLSGSDSWDDEL